MILLCKEIFLDNVNIISTWKCFVLEQIWTNNSQAWSVTLLTSKTLIINTSVTFALWQLYCCCRFLLRQQEVIAVSAHSLYIRYPQQLNICRKKIMFQCNLSFPHIKKKKFEGAQLCINQPASFNKNQSSSEFSVFDTVSDGE